MKIYSLEKKTYKIIRTRFYKRPDCWFIELSENISSTVGGNVYDCS
jgi:hypothetical protein